MKKMRLLLGFILSLFLLPSVQAETFKNVMVYYGGYGYNAQIQVELTVATATGVYYAKYYQSDRIAKVGNVPLQEWNGPAGVNAPSISFSESTEVNLSFCPGIHDTSDVLLCYREPLTITVDGTLGGCPWIISSKISSRSRIKFVWYEYFGPQTVISVCSPVPLEPYDVSWNEDRVVHDKVVRLQSNGQVIEQTLPTFLMKDGKLCDGSKFDEEGSYCRYVSQQISFSFSGCDNANVTVTPVAHPITDRQLHDMNLRVDTTAEQPIDSTCRFQYILNML